MLKGILLAGIVVLGGVIGMTGVSQVTARRDALREIAGDLRTLENLLVNQGMKLCDALTCVAAGSRVGGAYKMLARRLTQTSDSAEKTVEESGAMQELLEAELNEKEQKILREYFIKLAESISAEEISLVTARYCGELARVIKEIEECELGRAKVLRTVWLMACIGIAVILI